MSAVAARRWALIIAPVVAGTLTIVGVIADPAPGAEGRDRRSVFIRLVEWRVGSARLVP